MRKTKSTQEPCTELPNTVQTIVRGSSRGADQWTCRHVSGSTVRFDRGGKGHVAIRIGSEVAFLDCDEAMSLIEFLAGSGDNWR